MKVCGLTGGVGMGKTTVAALLVDLGAVVVDTDDIARDLVQPGWPALQEIHDVFGARVLDSEGRLRRDELARIVFSDSAARQKLEHILHPRIRSVWRAQIEAWRGEGRVLAVVVIPLLFETGAEACFDRIICAACLPASQHERLQKRGWDAAEIGRRNAAQLPVDQKISRSHYLVWTEGRPESTARQVEQIVSRL